MGASRPQRGHVLDFDKCLLPRQPSLRDPVLGLVGLWRERLAVLGASVYASSCLHPVCILSMIMPYGPRAG